MLQLPASSYKSRMVMTRKVTGSSASKIFKASNIRCNTLHSFYISTQKIYIILLIVRVLASLHDLDSFRSGKGRA